MPGAENNQNQNGTGAASDEQQNQQNGQAGAQGQGGENDEAQETPGMTLEEAQAEIKKLRKENASRRTTGKSLEERLQAMEGQSKKMKEALGIQDEEESPEVKLQQLQETAHIQQLNTEILGIAYETGVPPDSLEYFTFLFSKALDGLEDGAELSEEDIDAIVAKAKAAGSNSGPPKSGTSGANPPAANQSNNSQLTPEAFAKMNQLQKGELYAKNPDLYNSLFGEAKTKGLLFKAT